MVNRTVKNSHCPSMTKQINVTDLTASQKHELFISYLNQEGFIGFVKRIVGKQTYYTFTYQNSPIQHVCLK